MDNYDHERLDDKGLTERAALYPSRKEYQELIDRMKTDFDSTVFAVEKDQGFESAIHQIAQGFGDEEFYPGLEE